MMFPTDLKPLREGWGVAIDIIDHTEKIMEVFGLSSFAYLHILCSLSFIPHGKVCPGTDARWLTCSSPILTCFKKKGRTRTGCPHAHCTKSSPVSATFVMFNCWFS